MLEPGAIEFAIAQHHHRRPHGEQLVHLLDQRDMQVFGKVPLLALAYLPGQRQGTPFIDDMDHQRHTPTAHDAAIHDQAPTSARRDAQQDLGIRDKIDFLCDMVVLHPPGKAFDAALGLGAIRHLWWQSGQLRALAPDNAADQRRQGRQVPGDCPVGWPGYHCRRASCMARYLRRLSLMGCSFWIGRAFQREYTKVTTSYVLILQRLEKVSGREFSFRA